jgi:hypothetical protein
MSIGLAGPWMRRSRPTACVIGTGQLPEPLNQRMQIINLIAGSSKYHKEVLATAGNL